MSTALTGDNIYLFHYTAQLHACRLHLRCLEIGMKFSRRSPIAHVKRTYGFTGSNESVVRQFEEVLAGPAPVAAMQARIDKVVAASVASVPRT